MSTAPKVPTTLHTPRLTLTLASRSNAAHYECILTTLNNPTAYARHGDYGLRTPAQLDALNSALHITHPVAFPLDMIYIISLRSPSSSVPDSIAEPMIGIVTLCQRSKEIPPDIGWGLKEGFMGKGYATEAASEFLRALRENIGIKDVCTWPDPSNRQSNRVAEKLGFVAGGTVRVKEEPGKEVILWVLPGMVGVGDGKIEISFWGEKGKALK